MNKNFCEKFDCDYDRYYMIQAGGGNDLKEISYYTGKPFQRGYNIFSRFTRSYALPFLKYFGKKSVKLGKNLLQDVLAGEEPKEAFKTNLKRTANETINDVKKIINQKGSRRKRKKKLKIKKIRNKRKLKKSKKRNLNHSKKRSRKRKSKKRYKNIFN